MKLDPDDLQGLAAFCAKRFPSVGERTRFAGRVGLDAPGDAPDAWGRLLQEAQARGVLPRLLRALAEAAPGDQNLQTALGLIDDEAPPRGRIVAVAVAGLALLVMAGVWAWWSAAGEADAVPAGVRPAVAEASRSAPIEPVVTAPVVTAPAPAPVAEAAAPVVAAVAPPVPVAEAPAPVAQAPASERRNACDALSGEVIGWWYAGTRSPGAVGATVTLDRDARVRADHPSEANHFNAGLPERCVLARGTRQRLSHAPLNVSGDHWWVPYSPGDAR